MNNLSLKVEMSRYPNGERICVLKNTLGVPTYYENLYATVQHDKLGNSVNTAKSCLSNLSFFHEVCKFLDLSPVSTFERGNIFDDHILDAILDVCTYEKKNVLAMRTSQNNPKIVNSKRFQARRGVVVVKSGVVKGKSYKNRMLTIANYLAWLMRYVFPKTKFDSSKAERMKAYLLHRSERADVDDFAEFNSLDHNQELRLMDLIDPECSENLWKKESVKFRNYVMVMLMLSIGCRKGELLNLKTSNFIPGSRTLQIRRDADNPHDRRANPALVKTLSRDLELDIEIADLLERYILSYRQATRGAEKNPYLFITHVGKARELSSSALDKIFSQLQAALGFSVAPHSLRHTWNDRLSEMAELLVSTGEYTWQEIEDWRSYLMGWKEDSGTSKNYTKRYETKRAIAANIELQRKAMARFKASQNVRNQQLPF